MSDTQDALAAIARELLARYRDVDEVTSALRDALAADDLDRLDPLVSRRAALIEEAGALLASGTQLLAGQTVSTASRAAWADALAAARRAAEQDAQLRALLVSRAHEIPASLAELRGGRGALRAYDQSGVPPESVDRTG